MTVDLIKGRDLDGDICYDTADGFSVRKVSSGWIVIPPAGHGIRPVRSLAIARIVIANLREA